MLFNLSTQIHFKNQQQAEGAILCCNDRGPVFADDYFMWELGVLEPFNGEDTCQSFANLDGYMIGMYNGKNKLTN